MLTLLYGPARCRVSGMGGLLGCSWFPPVVARRLLGDGAAGLTVRGEVGLLGGGGDGVADLPDLLGVRVGVALGGVEADLVAVRVMGAGQDPADRGEMHASVGFAPGPGPRPAGPPSRPWGDAGRE